METKEKEEGVSIEELCRQVAVEDESVDLLLRFRDFILLGSTVVLKSLLPEDFEDAEVVPMNIIVPRKVSKDALFLTILEYALSTCIPEAGRFFAIATALDSKKTADAAFGAHMDMATALSDNPNMPSGDQKAAYPLIFFI